MGAMQRRKGRRGEQQTATELRTAFPELADIIKRGWQAHRGHDDADVIVPGLPVWFEVKTGAQPNVRAALRQAVECCTKSGDGHVPVAVIRDDRMEPFAVLRWSDLLSIMVARWGKELAK